MASDIIFFSLVFFRRVNFVQYFWQIKSIVNDIILILNSISSIQFYFYVNKKMCLKKIIRIQANWIIYALSMLFSFVACICASNWLLCSIRAKKIKVGPLKFVQSDFGESVGRIFSWVECSNESLTYYTESINRLILWKFFTIKKLQLIFGNSIINTIAE